MIAACTGAIIGAVTLLVCPERADVERALADIDPARAGASGAPRFDLAADDRGRTVVRVRQAGGAIIAERPLPTGLSCSERAQAAAVIIAANLGELPTDVLTPAAPALVSPAPAPPTRAPAPPPATREPTPPLAMAAAASAPAAPPSHRRAYELEAAVLGTVDGAGRVPGARAAAGLAVGQAGSLRLTALHVTTRRAPVGTGGVDWKRWAAAVGYAHRLFRGDSYLEGGLHAVAAGVRLVGHGFQSNERHWVLDPGSMLELRVGYGLVGGVGVHAGVTLSTWMRQHDLYTRDGRASGHLPRLEVLGALGLSWRASRR